MEECGRAIIEFFTNKPTNADVRAVLLQRPDLEPSFCVSQLPMAHFSESLEGLILLTNVSYFIFNFYSMIVLTSKIVDIFIYLKYNTYKALLIV